MTTDSLPHKEAFGQRKRSIFERAGGYLSSSRLRRVFKGKRDLTVLDVGCGYHAILLRGLDSHLKAGVGVDRAVDERLDGGKCRFYRGEIEKVLPELPDAGYDGILIIHTLEHLWEPVKILTECYRLLKPGGLLFVNVPS
jgi:ubiquinone/menaquinone biosynthesis C-methylase UbiE